MRLNWIRKSYNTLNTWRATPVFVAILIANAIFTIIYGLSMLGLFQTIELSAYDWALKRQAAQERPDERITIIWSRDADQRQWGWPLPDHVMAKLFERILEHKPRVLGLDLYRDLPVPHEKTAAYDRLTDIFKNQSNIVVIKKVAEAIGTDIPPPPILEGSEQVGFNDMSIDPSGVLRRGLLFMRDGEDNVAWSFSLRMALRYLEQEDIRIKNHPETGRTMIGEALLPERIDSNYGAYQGIDALGYQFLMGYPGAPREFKSIELNDVMFNEFDPSLIKDRIVIIGNRAEATGDFFFVPVGPSDKRLPGALLHAYMVSQLLNLPAGKPLHPVSLTDVQEQLVVWVCCMLAALLCLSIPNLWQFTFFFIGGLMTMWVAFEFSFINHIWIPIIVPMLAWFVTMLVMMTYMSYRQKSQWELLMNLFNRHVSGKTAALIWASRDQYLNQGRLRPQRFHASVMFADLRNFTSVAEGMELQPLMDWLNVYMENMVNIVERHDGQVNKFIGDALMAVFGTPLNQNDESIKNAKNAVECALKMREAIENLRGDAAYPQFKDLCIRVGICSGPLIAGSLGSIQRQEYTVIGDTVNTAERLEGFEKHLDAENPCRIFISESTRACLGEQYETERIGSVNLKGKNARLMIHQVIGKRGKLKRRLYPSQTPMQ
ncbi:MAG: adenylate/guanylate cyclase domain-containing protein [Pseudomonadota bacterium]